MPEASRSPIKSRPLRLPGQSLTEERDRILEDKLLLPLVIVLVMGFYAGMEWYRHLIPHKPSPWTATFFAGLCLLFFLFQLRRYWPRLNHFRQAIEGERAVGQYLERLRSEGYDVFHDVLGEGFNIDHVAIGPAGAMTIETKTWSKPLRGRPEVTFDGEKLLKAGFEPDRDPIVQAKAQAKWLQQLLEESTGRRTAVRPIVVIPGWFIERSKGSEVWVLEPKQLPGFLSNEKPQLSAEDAKLFAYYLSRHIRAREDERKR